MIRSLRSDVHDHFRQPAVGVRLDAQAVVGDRLHFVASSCRSRSSGSPQALRLSSRRRRPAPRSDDSSRCSASKWYSSSFSQSNSRYSRSSPAMRHVQCCVRAHRVEVLDDDCEQRLGRLGKQRVQVGRPDAQPQVGGVVKGFVHACDAITPPRGAVDTRHARLCVSSRLIARRGRLFSCCFRYGMTVS